MVAAPCNPSTGSGVRGHPQLQSLSPDYILGGPDLKEKKKKKTKDRHEPLISILGRQKLVYFYNPWGGAASPPLYCGPGNNKLHYQNYLKGYRNGSAVKSTYCFCGGARFNSHIHKVAYSYL